MSSDPPKRSFRLENVVFLSCILAGAFILIAWSWLVGGKEFQIGNPLYFLGLFAIGFVAGVVSPRSWWTCWLGIYLGQAFAYTQLPIPRPNAFWVLGFFFLLLNSFVSLPGAVTGALSRIAFRRMTASRPPS